MTLWDKLTERLTRHTPGGERIDEGFAQHPIQGDGRSPDAGRASGSETKHGLFYAETDETFMIGARNMMSSDRDRLDYDRETVMQQCLDAWRHNPMARRIVGLTSQYVIGGGIALTCKHKPTARFIKEFWEHPLNRMGIRTYEWCDELTRTGNLFVLMTTDAAGMSYVRAIPACDIESIEHRPNDVEQATRFRLRPAVINDPPKTTGQGSDTLKGWDAEGMVYAAYDEYNDRTDRDGNYAPIMLHYAINRPVGAQWGESDLTPVLKWLSRYSNWLEDRARLNRYRTSYMYVVKGKYMSEAERAARQSRLNMMPPTPGSILVADETESWEVIEPKLDSGDANADGLAIKKMIAAGSGIPLHFLAEPESSTRTTAEAAGGPTFRHFEQRQNYFMWIIKDVISVAINRRNLVDGRMPQGRPSEVEVNGTDISSRDNVSLSLAGNNINNVLTSLRDRGMIDDAEYLRMIYRFTGEAIDVQEMLERGRAAAVPGIKNAPETRPEQKPGASQGTGETGKKMIDPETGEEK